MIYALLLSYFVMNGALADQVSPHVDLVGVYTSQEMCAAAQRELLPLAQAAPEQVTKFALTCVALKTDQIPDKNKRGNT
jgi:hypothetical protein